MALIRDEDPDSMHPHEALYGLLKKYSGMRKDLIKMLEGDLDPSEVQPTPVIRKLDGRVVVTKDSDIITAEDIQGQITEQQ